MIQTEASVEDEQIKCMKDNEMRFRNCWREEKGVCQGKQKEKGWMDLPKKRQITANRVK